MTIFLKLAKKYDPTGLVVPHKEKGTETNVKDLYEIIQDNFLKKKGNKKDLNLVKKLKPMEMKRTSETVLKFLLSRTLWPTLG